VSHVNNFTVNPGARVLWCLRRRTSDIRCVLRPDTAPIEVHVMQDRELVIKEVFGEEWLALNWAREYGERLKQNGWRESPHESTPESAA
jgi:hypothetical protein